MRKNLYEEERQDNYIGDEVGRSLSISIPIISFIFRKMYSPNAWKFWRIAIILWVPIEIAALIFGRFTVLDFSYLIMFIIMYLITKARYKRQNKQ